MNDVEPSLFELSESQTPPKRPRRARNREIWACTVTAEVFIVDAAAVQGAVEHYVANTVVIDVSTGLVIRDPAPDDVGPDPTLPLFDQLPWLISPTDAVEILREEGAFRVVDIELAATPEAADRGTVTWTVTAKLTDVQLLRRLATQAHPDDAELIADSLALAWQRAADPFAPLRSIPGIIWRPVSVDVEHIPAQIARTW